MSPALGIHVQHSPFCTSVIRPFGTSIALTLIRILRPKMYTLVLGAALVYEGFVASVCPTCGWSNPAVSSLPVLGLLVVFAYACSTLILELDFGDRDSTEGGPQGPRKRNPVGTALGFICSLQLAATLDALLRFCVRAVSEAGYGSGIPDDNDVTQLGFLLTVVFGLIGYIRAIRAMPNPILRLVAAAAVVASLVLYIASGVSERQAGKLLVALGQGGAAAGGDEQEL